MNETPFRATALNLIVYWTKYGATRTIAQAICNQLGASAQAAGVEAVQEEQIKKADRVIIGSPLYLFKIPAAITKFIRHHKELLLTRKLFIFLSSTMTEKQVIQKWGQAWISHFFDPEICKQVTTWHCLGGKRVFNELSAMDKTILTFGKKQYGDAINIEDFDSIDNAGIIRFCNKIEEAV